MREACSEKSSSSESERSQASHSGRTGSRSSGDIISLSRSSDRGKNSCNEIGWIRFDKSFSLVNAAISTLPLDTSHTFEILGLDSSHSIASFKFIISLCPVPHIHVSRLSDDSGARVGGTSGKNGKFDVIFSCRRAIFFAASICS